MRNPASALELLTSQHREVDKLIASIEATAHVAEKRKLFEALADNLAAHATIEEKLFYPWAKHSQTEDRLRESVEEHLAIKRVLADMLDMNPSDEQWDAKLSVLKEDLAHHAHDEEEQKLFPAIRARSSQEDRDALGGEMLAMFEELIGHEPRNEIPAETDHAAPV